MLESISKSKFMKNKILNSFLLNSLFLLSITLLFSNCKDSSNSNNSTTNSTDKSEKKYESQSLTCSECGKSFLKSNGVQLTGHSEVFCGSTCATNWAWSHNIGVN